VVEECWLVAVRKLQTFNPERGSFCHWVRGIAAHVFLTHLRARRLHPTRPLAAGDEQAKDESVQRPRAEKVAWAFARLTERHEQLLRAKYLDGASVESIAADWDESAKAVESLLTGAGRAFHEVYQANP
jgi:RNA polymerase sigma factor (sigma-70 family)